MKKTLQLAILALFPLALSAKPVVLEAMPSQDTLRVDTLGEIVVKSRYQYAKRKGDGYVVSFKGSPFYKGKTLEEGLTLCPLLTKRGDSFSIVGKESASIYINGRPSTMTGSDLMAYLSTRSTEEVDHIEIMPNPSGKYKTSNKAGVINIVTKASSSVGFMGTVSDKLTKGKKWGDQVNGMFGLGLKNLNLNLFATYANQSKSRYSGTTYYFDEASPQRETSNFRQKGQPLTTMLSGEWKLKNNLFGVSYTYASLRVDQDADNTSVDNEPFKKLTDTRNVNHTLQVYDDMKWGNTTLSLLYNYYYRKNKQDNLYRMAEEESQYDHGAYRVNNLKVDMETRLGKSWTLRYGVSGNRLSMETDYAYDEWRNKIAYEEKNAGAYVTTSLDIDDLNISGGLTYEHTSQDYAGNRKSYNYLLPQVTLTWNKRWGALFLAYHKEVDKVPYSNLSLSPVYFSPRSAVVGNPALKLQVAHYLSLGYGKGNLNAELFYRRYNDPWSQYSTQEDGDIISTYRNLDRNEQYGLNVGYTHAFSSWLLAKAYWETYWDRTSLGEGERQSSWYNYLSGNVLVKLDKKNRVDVTLGYWAMFPHKTEGMEWRNRASFSMSVNWNVIKDKLRATLAVDDLFNQDMARYTVVYGNTRTYHHNTFDNRKVSLTIRYTFSNKRSAKSNRRRAVDEVSRIPAQ